MKTIITTIGLLFTILTLSFAQQQPTGKQLYQTNCIRCHGTDGNKGFWGAGKLYKSKMDDAAIATIIKNGRRVMPAFKTKLKETEIKLVADYIKTLRTQK